MNWTIEQLCYFAGIFDGEGHLSIEKQSINGKTRKKDYYTLRIVIANTNLELIQWLIQTFNGNFTISKKVVGHKQVYKFVLFGKKLEDVITAAYSYFIVKKPIIDIALKFRKTVGKTGSDVSEETMVYRRQLYFEAKRINKPGDHIHPSPLLP